MTLNEIAKKNNKTLGDLYYIKRKHKIKNYSVKVIKVVINKEIKDYNEEDFLPYFRKDI